MKLFQFVFTCSLLLFSIQSLARDYYIIFDEGCMDRLEYSFNGSDNDKPFLVYHIDISQTEKVVLEVGFESEALQSYVPNNFWRCDNVDLSLERIQNIITNGDQVFIIRRIASRQYAISKVKFASYYKFDGNVIQYFSPKYRFEFDLETGVIGENIAFETRRSEVYFEGRLDNECTGAFIFRQYSEQFNKPAHTDILVVPEIGVVEERSGKNVEDAFNQTLLLEKVNGLDQKTHLRIACGKLDPNEIPSSSDEIVLKNTSDVLEGKGSNTVNPKESAQQVADAKDFHVIEPGETLYSIARNNDISLTQLLQWNNLTKMSTIFPGDRLRISPEPTPSRFAERGGDNNPAPYDINISRDQNTPSSVLPANYDEIMEGYHIVKPGETVASIALKYGFTEEKFREMNGVAPNGFPRIGQRLRTTECDCPAGTENMDPTNGNNAANSYNYFQENTNPDSYENFSARTSNQDRFNRDTPINRNIPTFYDEQVRNNQQPYYESSEADNRPSYYDFRLPNTRKVHTVEDGETIYTIARKYDITIEEIRKWNGMEKNEVVIPYQRLYIEK